MESTLRQFVKLAVWAVVFPVATAAAQTTDRGPRTEAKGHLGAFYFTPKVALKEFGVDGNVFNNADQIPKLPDWAIVDVRTPPNSKWPGKMVAANFFDEEWKLKPHRAP